VLAALIFLTSIATAQYTVKIETLAIDGPAKALSIWKTASDYLTTNVMCPLPVKQH
jgi:hypothetical protein